MQRRRLRMVGTGCTKQRGPLLWTTGTTRNTAYCVIEGGVLLLRPLVYFCSGVDSQEHTVTVQPNSGAYGYMIFIRIKNPAIQALTDGSKTFLHRKKAAPLKLQLFRRRPFFLIPARRLTRPWGICLRPRARVLNSLLFRRLLLPDTLAGCASSLLQPMINC